MVKLAQALIAAQRPGEALTLLDDPRLGKVASTKFWRAQALAGLHRWSEALPLYQAVSSDEASPFCHDAFFGAAEMLRALARPDQALQALGHLLQDKQWNTRARLRAAELLLDKSDADNARRMLDAINPTATAERKERRFLRARLELVQGRPQGAIVAFESLVKKPDSLRLRCSTAKKKNVRSLSKGPPTVKPYCLRLNGGLATGAKALRA